MTDVPAFLDEPPDDRFAHGLRLGSPLAFASFLLAISFGIAAEPVFGQWGALAFSAFVFAGSAQFAATAVLAAGGSALAAIVAGVLLNLRFLPMSVSIAPWVRGRMPWRAFQGQTVVDASWALANEGEGRFDPVKMMGATATAYPAWVGGTAVGVFAGDILGDPQTLGLDAIFPAFFLALLFGELAGGPARVAAGVGALIAVALVPFTPPGIPILAASLGAVVALVVRTRA